MDIDEYVCPRPPTIVKRKKSVSRISGCSVHHETRLSSSLFSLAPEDFDDLHSCNDEMFTDMSPPPIHRFALHDHDDLDFDRISPTSVMDVLYYPMMTKNHKRNHHARTQSGFPQVPDLMASFSSDESSSSCSSIGTPSPKRNRHKIQKWSSFHEHGRDWGTSHACDPTVTQALLDLLARMEEEDDYLQDE